MTNTRIRVFIIAVSFILVFVGFFVADYPRRIELDCMGFQPTRTAAECLSSNTGWAIFGYAIVGVAAVAALFAMFVMQSPPRDRPAPLSQ